MVISIHQPAYLPWLGYCDKIARSDVFVFMDSVQFERGWFINRNLVKTANGPVMLTIPVNLTGHTSSGICDIPISDFRWVDKHLKTIEQAYSKAPYFKEIWPLLQGLYARASEKPLIADLCLEHLYFWLARVGVHRQIIRSSQLGQFVSDGSGLVLEMCLRIGATTYISGSHGKDYLDLAAFKHAGIEIQWQQFEHPVYPQQHGEFIPNMGIIDLRMNRRSLL